eukprot:TRINITY_DN43851_c0_g1_i1.p2 TRINITY_DN43851_c0_g1~~TRINITY_DN43851_c0_g1_i1.p2  ORF type:complete len:193 (-),score=39.38 TRINITY_DN43851_c0_g1_i1:189-707(-)
MAGLRVSVKFGRETRDIEFESADATIGELREQIEQECSVVKTGQTLICAGRKWQGIAYGDALKIAEAAGSGAKEVMGVKTVTLMLMGCDNSEVVSRFEAQIDEAAAILDGVPEKDGGDAAKKQLFEVEDILKKVTDGLDNVSVVGAQRERRRGMIRRVEAMSEAIETRKASL